MLVSADNKFEKLDLDFLWEGIRVKKIHLVDWKLACSLLSIRGLV